MYVYALVSAILLCCVRECRVVLTFLSTRVDGRLRVGEKVHRDSHVRY